MNNNMNENPRPYVTPFVVSNARYINPNFRGDRFGKGGERNFGLLLDPILAQKLTEDGWDVKWPPADRTKQNGEPLNPIIYPRIKFFGPGDKRNPIIDVIEDGLIYRFDENRVGDLDNYYTSRIEKVDCVIGGWWSEHRDGTPFIKAGCNNLRIVLRSNPRSEVTRQWNAGYEDFPFANMNPEEIPFN